MPMKNPPHPGRIIKQDCLEPLGLTVTDTAKALGVTRENLSSLINGKTGVSPEMAIRLEKAFGGSARTWLALQQAYNLAQINPDKIKVKKILPSGVETPVSA